MKKFRENLLYGITLIIFIASISMPSILIKGGMERRKNKVYNGGDIFQETVLNVEEESDTSYENKLLMVSGGIEMSREAVTLVNINMAEQENEIINKVNQITSVMNKEVGLPETIDSYYQNWFTTKAQLYKYQEEVFHLYSALVWEVTYKKYNGTVIQKVLIDKETNDIYKIELSYAGGDSEDKGKEDLVTNLDSEDYFKIIGFLKNKQIDNIEIQQETGAVHVKGTNGEQCNFRIYSKDQQIVMEFFPYN